MNIRILLCILVLTACTACVRDRYLVSPGDLIAPGGITFSFNTTTISDTSIIRDGYESFNFGSAVSPGATGFVVTIHNSKLNEIRMGQVAGTVTFNSELQQPLSCQHLRFAATNELPKNYFTAYLVPTSILKEVMVGKELYRVMPYGTYKLHLIMHIEDHMTETDVTVQYTHRKEIVNPSRWQ